MGSISTSSSAPTPELLGEIMDSFADTAIDEPQWFATGESLEDSSEKLETETLGHG